MQRFLNESSTISGILSKTAANRTTNEISTLNKFESDLLDLVTNNLNNITEDFLNLMINVGNYQNNQLLSALQNGLNKKRTHSNPIHNPDASTDNIIDFSALNTTVKFNCQATDELSPTQLTNFILQLKNFFAKKVFLHQDAADLTSEEWANAYASFCISLSEQYTSKTNSSNPDTINTFSVNNKEYVWTQKGLWDMLNSIQEFKGNPNVLRRYGRTHFDQISRTLNEINYIPTGRIAAKNGVVSNFRRNISDFAPSYKSFSTPQEQAAALAGRDYAVTRGGEKGTIVHTAQVVGNTRR